MFRGEVEEEKLTWEGREREGFEFERSALSPFFPAKVEFKLDFSGSEAFKLELRRFWDEFEFDFNAEGRVRFP